MARWNPVPVVGGAYSDDSRPWSCQDTVNYIPVMAERPGGRSPSMLRAAPGWLTFCASMQPAPVRGLHNVEGVLLAVTGNTLYRIGLDGAATGVGTVPGVGRVSMAHNQIAGGNEVMIANGDAGYVYNTVSGELARVTDTGFPGFKVCDFVDGYIFGVEPQGRYWLFSDLADATSYNTLDRGQAESQPDRIVTAIVSHREVLILGQRTGEFFRNTGAATGTFQRIDGTEMEVGCASTFSAAKLDSSVFWLGHDGIVYRLEGYRPRRISTHAIEQDIARCNMAQAFAFTYESRGHKIYYLSFPDGRTWGYDVASGEWHRRESKGLDRWRLNALTYWNGHWIGGDYSNGRLYQLDWGVDTEAGEEITYRRVTGVLHDNQNRVTVNGIELVFDTGVKASDRTLTLAGLSISGDLPDGEKDVAITPYTYRSSGGTWPFAFSIIGGALPDGLSLDASGRVAGTPTVGGDFAWTVLVEDGDDGAATLDDAATIAYEPAAVLLHFDEAEGATEFTDDGENATAASGWSAAGDAQVTAAAAVYGAGGLSYTSGYAKMDGSTTFVPVDTGDFTMEGTFNLPSGTGTHTLFRYQLTGFDPSWQVTVDAVTGVLAFVTKSFNGSTYDTVVVAESAAGAFPLGESAHVAWDRESDTIRLFVGGVKAAEGTHAGSLNPYDTAHEFRLGGGPLAASCDEFRITVGQARYVSDFDPPTEAFPNP